MDHMQKQPHRAAILNELSRERDRQDTLWGHDFDDKNTLNDWISYITRYAGAAGSAAKTPNAQRAFMFKATTIGLAALEAFGRNKGFPPRHYEDIVRKAGDVQ
jgi:hypothetical protein